MNDNTVRTVPPSLPPLDHHCHHYVLAELKITIGHDNMWPNLQNLVLYTHPILRLWRDITFFSELSGQKFQSYQCNDRTVLLPNFKAIGQTQAELYSLKVEELDACTRPLFTNSVTYVVTNNSSVLSTLLNKQLQYNCDASFIKMDDSFVNIILISGYFLVILHVRTCY